MTGLLAPRRETRTSADIDRLATDVDDRVVVSAVVEAGSPNVALGGRRLRAGWQIGLLVAGMPVWWALGVTELIFPILAAPLAWQLRKGPLRVPPGFWIWALFLVWVSVSALMLNLPVPHTLSSEGIGRFIAYTVRLLQYVAVTVILLYVVNATERELPRARLLRWVGWLGVSSVAFGIAAIFYPDLAFPTLISRVLPESLLQGDGLAHLAQVQDVLGDASPRPAAPFEFTNTWGSVLSLCLILGIVAWGALGSTGKRALLCCLLGMSAVPIVYSLNRAVWAGFAIACVYVVGRLALRGRLLAGFVSLIVAAAVSVTFVVSPLGMLIGERFDNPHSNEVRSALAEASWNAAVFSPIIGAGSTRNTIGSERSIAIGPSAGCSKCGQRVIGSTGQFWMVLIAQGFVGAALYLAFLLRMAWYGRHDASPLGIAASLILLLQVFYAFFYTALTIPLTIAMISVGILCRNSELRASQRSRVSKTSVPGVKR